MNEVVELLHKKTGHTLHGKVKVHGGQTGGRALVGPLFVLPLGSGRFFGALLVRRTLAPQITAAIDGGNVKKGNALQGRSVCEIQRDTVALRKINKQSMNQPNTNSKLNF